ESRAWIRFLAETARSRIENPYIIGHLAPYLTNRERKALKKKLKEWGGGFELENSFRDVTPSPEAPPSTTDTRLATGYPPQFVSEALREIGCSLDSDPIFGLANLLFDGGGRPGKVQVTLLGRVAPSPQCAKAATALFASVLQPLGDIS